LICGLALLFESRSYQTLAWTVNGHTYVYIFYRNFCYYLIWF